MLGRIDRRAAENFMRARIAVDLEPAPAAGAVVPQLVMRTARVVAQIHVVGPFAFGRVGRRPRQRRIAAVGEFDLVPRAAPRTGNQHHDRCSSFNVPTGKDQRPFRRSRSLR